MPTSFSAFTKRGNILLTPDMVFRMEKEVDKGRSRVSYRIKLPVVEGTRVKWIEDLYEEVLIEGVNDDPKSLEKVKKEILD